MGKTKKRNSGNRKGSKHLTKEDKDKICGTLSTKVSVEEIANIFKVPRSTIYRYRSKVTQTNSVVQKEGSGGPRVTLSRLPD